MTVLKTTVVGHFLKWWDVHRERCAECKRDNLYSQCAEYRANKVVTDKYILGDRP